MSIPFDAITTVFIFLIGLPAILLQTLAPELRKIVVKRRGQLVLFTAVPIGVAGCIVSVGVWLSSIGMQAAEFGSHQSNVLAAILYSNSELLWTTVLTILLLITGVSAIVLTQRWRREAVISQLQAYAAKGISRRGRPVESKLTDLVQLGKQSQSGQDKELVLQALANLAESVQASPGYDGRQLEVLIIGLEEILVLGPQIGSSENFHAAADLLSDIVISASDTIHTEDLKLGIQTISMLGRTSLKLEPSHIQMKFVEALALANAGENAAATWMSQALFEIGSKAAECRQTLVTMASLSKLDSLAQKHRPISGELATDFISLIAHLWVQGETARSYVLPMLEEASTCFSQSLSEAIKSAGAHCKQTAKFETSDYLSELLKGIENGLPTARLSS